MIWTLITSQRSLLKIFLHQFRNLVLMNYLIYLHQPQGDTSVYPQVMQEYLNSKYNPEFFKSYPSPNIFSNSLQFKHTKRPYFIYMCNIIPTYLFRHRSQHTTENNSEVCHHPSQQPTSTSSTSTSTSTTSTITSDMLNSPPPQQ